MAKKVEHEKNSYLSVLRYVSDELESAKREQDLAHQDFDDLYKMLHCESISEMSDIDSDISLPEFVSRVLSIIGDFVAKYFGSREFVDIRMTSEDPKDVIEARASKKLLNNILSLDNLYYFQKIVRLMMFVIIYGYGIIKGSYRQTTRSTKTGQRPVERYIYDDNGNPIAEDGTSYTGASEQIPMTEVTYEDIMESEVIEDFPDFDVYDIRNVYFSPEYAYSLKDKDWVIFKSRLSTYDMRRDQGICGYFESSIKALEEMERTGEAKKKKAANKSKHISRDPEIEDDAEHPVVKYRVYERWGKMWYDPETEGPGFDKDGKILKTATLEECIISWVTTGLEDVPELLIRFQKSPYPIRPMVRFICYIDPHKDVGFGDGEPVRQLQIAADDTFNVSNFRTLLATTPAFKAKMFQHIPEEIKVSPRHAIQLENPTEDLIEFEIDDNIQGSMMQLGMIRQSINEVMAQSPMDAGIPPENRETATMGSILAQKSATRSGLRTASIEFGGFVELYAMILSMVNTFMLPETLIELVGEELAVAYNPKRKDRFFPVSQALEPEFQKQFKVKMLDQVLGRIISLPNPKTAMSANFIIGQILETVGGDFKLFKRFMLEEDPIAIAMYQAVIGKSAAIAPSTPNMGGPMAQNQQGLPVGAQEQVVREGQQ